MKKVSQPSMNVGTQSCDENSASPYCLFSRQNFTSDRTQSGDERRTPMNTDKHRWIMGLLLGSFLDGISPAIACLFGDVAKLSTRSQKILTQFTIYGDVILV
ncbi:hypothetical protein [Fischerella sp. NIES-3754]|uniref:hypothetical protein n=1 Tax=Fischerella sp. NIES-3754 TaxID=1752063 RepID=UPI0015D6C796|nr:hypothetical protein [Fischerella sp. NIES-3754]